MIYQVTNLIKKTGAEMEEVLGVFKNRYRQLHTTKSWDFVGLPLTAKRHLKAERDVIIGVLDTGLVTCYSYLHTNVGNI